MESNNNQPTQTTSKPKHAPAAVIVAIAITISVICLLVIPFVLLSNFFKDASNDRHALHSKESTISYLKNLYPNDNFEILSELQLESGAKGWRVKSTVTNIEFEAKEEARSNGTPITEYPVTVTYNYEIGDSVIKNFKSNYFDVARHKAETFQVELKKNDTYISLTKNTDYSTISEVLRLCREIQENNTIKKIAPGKDMGRILFVVKNMTNPNYPTSTIACKGDTKSMADIYNQLH